MTSTTTPRAHTEQIRSRARDCVVSFLDEQETRLAQRGFDRGSIGRRSWAVPLFDALRDFLVGGKLLRPAFCYWGWRAAGGVPENDEAAVRAGAAIELLHLFALIHDDIIDDSATRRGWPTVHRRFAQLHAGQQWHGSPDAFGASAAILLGDLCLVWSYQVLLDNSLPVRTLAALAATAHHGNVDLVTGQYLDLLLEAEGNASEGDALVVARYKTTVYTVEHPLRVGATLVDPRSPALPVLDEFAGHLGEAFQLRDDVLGVFGDPDLTGKPTSDDLLAGKQTLLVTLARRHGTTVERRELDDLMRRADPTEDQLERCRAILVDTGALSRVENRIAERAARSHEVLGSSGLNAEVQAGLGDLVNLVIHRQR